MKKSSALAAVLPGEADLLTAVAANPTDDDTKLVYADWLEDHDDRRGSFLRQFVAAVQEEETLPKTAGLPTAWLEILGVHLVTRLRDLGLGDYWDAILATARPTVVINTVPLGRKKLPLGTTQFGGLPSLPAGTTWPRCERAPLEFLAQFDLADLQRAVAGRALPAEGLLSFFMYHDYDQDEFGGEEGRGPSAGGLQILYTAPGSELVALNPPDDLTETLGRPRSDTVCKAVIADALDLPDHADTWPRIHVSYLHSKLVNDADHQLFGYSHVTVLASDPTPGPEWEQLIRFNSDSKLHWGWGDGHRLFWYIRSADLKSCRFDNTKAIDG